jgi:hypothetical protein
MHRSFFSFKAYEVAKLLPLVGRLLPRYLTCHFSKLIIFKVLIVLRAHLALVRCRRETAILALQSLCVVPLRRAPYCKRLAGL